MHFILKIINILFLYLWGRNDSLPNVQHVYTGVQWYRGSYIKKMATEIFSI